ncbi:lectin domain containing protein [Pelagibacter phage HTVC041P]|uniref:Lectin domain containing protein n=1 Tax=Pelagibacter phage HTVC041P TaxID=3072833 RepID=A0AAX4G2R7_9CAUD|nr:lectin domain containing protein [Pelagibacter phage HTVC041P]
MATTYLGRTQGTATLRTKCTLSVWIKRSKLSGGSYQFFVSSYISGSDRMGFYFNTDDTLSVYSPNWNLHTNRQFRDVNGWYHIVYRIDTTHGNTSDRVRLYVNGVQETSFGTANYPSQNYNLEFGTSSHNMYIGNYDNNQYYFDGIMSHLHFLDGEDRDASYFGETDTTTGEWKIKTDVTGVNYGNQGFFLFKDNNSTSDQSGNSNNFTVYTGASGSLTKTEDCPDNVFATLNTLNSYWAGGTFSNGNTKIQPSSSAHGAWNTGTLGMTSGKYYWEVKVSGSNNGAECQVGIADKSPNGNTQSSTAGTSFGYNSNGEYGIYAWNGAFIGNAVVNPYTSYGSSCSNGIIMIAIDLDNNKFYGGLNGTWFDSGNPANGTNGKTIQAVASTQDKCYYPAISTYQGYTGTAEFNFGNGYFGTTAVSSAGTNASGIGIFEYDVPSGYTALSTKGLNE